MHNGWGFQLGSPLTWTLFCQGLWMLKLSLISVSKSQHWWRGNNCKQQSILPQNLSPYKYGFFSCCWPWGNYVYVGSLWTAFYLLYWSTLQCVPAYTAGVHIINTLHACSSGCFLSRKAKDYTVWFECSYANAGRCAVFQKRAANQLLLWFMSHYQEGWNCLGNSQVKRFLLVK